MSGTLEKWTASAQKTLNEKNVFTDYLAKLEAKTGIPRLKLATGAVIVTALYMMVGYGSDLICNVIGFAYPAYKSIKAIETKKKDDDTIWLTYWVVYAMFLLVEYFTDLLLSWIPVYWFLKCSFLIFCMLPGPYSGSMMIYKSIIRPSFLKHHTTLEHGVQQAADIGRAVMDEAKHIAEDVATDVIQANARLSEGTSESRKAD